MQSIAFFNNKGGVGKTTLLCNIASYLSVKKNKDVLIVDADPQCNATQYMFDDKKIDKIFSSTKSFTIYRAVEPIASGKGYPNTFHHYASSTFGVDVMVGDPKLALTEDLLAEDWSDAIGGRPRGLRTTFIFKHILSHFEDYDYVLFDMGPSLGSINRSVLLACDFFIVPMAIDIFSLRACENISTWIKRWQKQLKRGIELNDEDDDELGLDVSAVDIKFGGYVSQQYTAKSDTYGNKVAVKAYDQVMQKLPSTIEENFSKKFGNVNRVRDYELGKIPNLHSLIPMSQNNRKPIFRLVSTDGVVGAHFSRVREAELIFSQITDNMVKSVDDDCMAG